MHICSDLARCTEVRSSGGLYKHQELKTIPITTKCFLSSYSTVCAVKQILGGNSRLRFQGELLHAKLCLPSLEIPGVINLASAGEDLRTAGESLQQPGCVRKLSFYIKQNQQFISPLASLQQFPAKILKISQVLHHTWQQAHAHLTDESECYPYLQGEKLVIKSRPPIRSRDLQLHNHCSPASPCGSTDMGNLKPVWDHKNQETPICIRKTLWKL